MVSLLLVGFATNFWFALAGRVFGGLLSTCIMTRISSLQHWLTCVDGNIGVIQTMVGELVKKPEHERKHEKRFS